MTKTTGDLALDKYSQTYTRRRKGIECFLVEVKQALDSRSDHFEMEVDLQGHVEIKLHELTHEIKIRHSGGANFEVSMEGAIVELVYDEAATSFSNGKTDLLHVYANTIFDIDKYISEEIIQPLASKLGDEYLP